MVRFDPDYSPAPATNRRIDAARSDANQAASRIGRNSGITLASHAIGATFNLVALAMLARGLGPSGLGQYYTVLVAATIVQLLTEAGIPTLLTHRIAKRPHDRQRILGEAYGLLMLVLVTSVVSLLLLGAAWGYFSGRLTQFTISFCLAAIACGAMQVQQFAIGVVRGFEVFKYEGASRVIQQSVLAGLLLALGPQSSSDLHRALAIWASSHFVAASFLVGVVQWQWPCKAVQLKGAIVRHWLQQSVPVAVGDMLRRVTVLIDHLLLSVLAPASMLGIYNVAIRLITPLGLISGTLGSAMFPYISRSADADPQALRKAFASGIRLLWIVSLPLSLIVIVLAENLVLFLAGPNFLEAVLPTRVLAAVILLTYPSTKFRFVLIAIGKQRWFTTMALTTLLFEAAVEASLIPFLGYMGACTGFIIGETYFLFLGLVACHRLRVGQVEWVLVLRAIPPAVAMATALWFCLDLPLILQLTAAIFLTGVYLILCGISGAFRREESVWLISILRRLWDRRLSEPQQNSAKDASQ